MSSARISNFTTQLWMRHHSAAVLVIAIAATSLVGLLWLVLPQLVGYWEHATYDLRLRWQGAAKPDDHIVIISRDEESERDSALGPGLWDRARFAEVVTALTQAGARTIALDFFMQGTSPPERGNGKSDQALVTSTKSGRVLYPIVTEPGDGAVGEPSAGLHVLAQLLPSFSPEVIRVLPQAGHIEGPFPALAAVVPAVGDITAWPDADGMFRRVPTFIGFGDRAVPTFGVAMAASFLDIVPDHIELVPGQALRFRDARFPDGHQQTISVPVDAEGRLLIRYAGQWSDHKIPNKRFLDVLNQIRHGKNEAALQEEYSNKLVLLINAGLMSDRGNTPYETSVPGGFILANIANTILTQQAMQEASPVTHWGLVFGLGLCAVGAVVFLPGWFGVIGVIGMAVGYTVLTFLGMSFAGLVLPMVAPLVSLGIAVILAMSWVKVRTTDQAKQLRLDYEVLQHGLVAQQGMLVQQRTQVDQLMTELMAAQEEAAKNEEGHLAVQQTITTLQKRLHTAKCEVSEQTQLMEELQGKLTMMQPARIEQEPLAVDEQEGLRKECENHGIITRDSVMLDLWKDFRTMAADRFLPILILGESGTGKELFARAAGTLSGLSSPFVSVNMANIGDTAESALFGHEAGAFTGAVRRHNGYFLQANNGTIFLDEIGDLSSPVQAKLLRVLENGEVWRMGAEKPASVKVRVVAATNQNLRQAIKKGMFREDLYSRLCGKVLRLPPLRERLGDIPVLAQYFVEEEAKKRGRSEIILSQGALDRLKSWRPVQWNIRELRQCMARAVVLALKADSMIMVHHLDLDEELGLMVRSDTPPAAVSAWVDTLESNDHEFLRILRTNAFDIGKTASELGRDRSTVTSWLKGLCFEALVQHGGDVQAAAVSLAIEPGLTTLVIGKLKEYVEPIRHIVLTSPSPEAAFDEYQRRFYKSVKQRYFNSVNTLVQRFWSERGFIQSGSS